MQRCVHKRCTPQRRNLQKGLVEFAAYKQLPAFSSPLRPRKQIFCLDGQIRLKDYAPDPVYRNGEGVVVVPFRLL
jgi:hypothetical protein